MNNKRGGAGGIFLLVVILMIASAIGGAYGYSVLDAKMAVKDAQKEIEGIRLSDYDKEEADEIQGYIDQATKDLETSKSRKEVYDVLDDFKTDVSKVMTKTEKELEKARQEVEEARKNMNNNNNNNNSGSYNNNNGYEYYSDGTTGDSGNYKGNEINSGNSNNGTNNYGYNDQTDDQSDDQSEDSGLLGLFRGKNDTSGDDTEA